jgi:hypothetical protein
VTPFVTEDVGLMLDRHLSLRSCYCFNTDFPHVEGGRNPLRRMGASVSHLPGDVLERFFVTNAQLLLPPTVGPSTP